MAKILLLLLAVALIAPDTVFGGKVEVENGIINCDGFMCPPNSYTCVVSKQSISPNHDQYKHTKDCYDIYGQRAFITTTLTNPNPGERMAFYFEYLKVGDYIQINYEEPDPPQQYMDGP